MRDNLKALGMRMRAARVDAKLGQLEIANRLGVSKQLASHWELGRSEITIFDLAKFAQITGTSAEYLLTGLSNSFRQRPIAHAAGRADPETHARRDRDLRQGQAEPCGC